MEYFKAIEALPGKEVAPGYYGRFIHLEGMTVGYFEVKAGSVLPTHQHHNEQITTVLEGRFEMTVDGVTQICEPGQAVVLPAHTPHGGVALTDCRLMDAFCPVRDDYK